MMASTTIVCGACGVPFTRTGAARSSGFYRTHAENDTCICCREGLDPVTLEPLATRGQPMKAETLTDVELIEALEGAGPRLRLARIEDLRQIADAIADVAAEAGRRLEARSRLAGPLEGKIRDVAIDAAGRMTARLEVNLR
jgi:hypothetical protein